jgi:hypothetical protein
VVLLFSFPLHSTLAKVRYERGNNMKEIEKMLGFDSVTPINATPSDSDDMINKDQELKDWYEEELKRFVNMPR